MEPGRDEHIIYVNTNNLFKRPIIWSMYMTSTFQPKCIKYDKNVMHMYVLNDMPFSVVCVFSFYLYYVFL